MLLRQSLTNKYLKGPLTNSFAFGYWVCILTSQGINFCSKNCESNAEGMRYYGLSDMSWLQDNLSCNRKSKNCVMCHGSAMLCCIILSSSFSIRSAFVVAFYGCMQGHGFFFYFFTILSCFSKTLSFLLMICVASGAWHLFSQNTLAAPQFFAQ